MSLRVTILGCGSFGRRTAAGARLGRLRSGQSEEPPPALLDPGRENRRRRHARASWSTPRRTCASSCSDADVDWLDGVLITHEHADHTHGIDDLRGLFIHRQSAALDIYLDEPTSRVMFHRFGYCFVSPPGSNYPPIANEHRIMPGHPITIDGDGGPITALPFLQDHGDIASLGFRFGGLAYSSDLVRLPDESVPALAGLDVWIVDALRYKPHPSHFSVDEALGWIERHRPAARDPDQPAFRSRLRGTARAAAGHMSSRPMTGCGSRCEPLIGTKLNLHIQ